MTGCPVPKILNKCPLRFKAKATGSPNLEHLDNNQMPNEFIARAGRDPKTNLNVSMYAFGVLGRSGAVNVWRTSN